MNKVYLSGLILDEPMLKTEKDGSMHLVFHLGMRHRTKSGEPRKEAYRISGWNRLAEWGSMRLERLQPVCVRGHLTQRTWTNGEQKRTETEVVAQEIILCQKRTDARTLMTEAASAEGT